MSSWPKKIWRKPTSHSTTFATESKLSNVRAHPFPFASSSFPKLRWKIDNIKAACEGDPSLTRPWLFVLVGALHKFFLPANGRWQGIKVWRWHHVLGGGFGEGQHEATKLNKQLTNWQCHVFSVKASPTCNFSISLSLRNVKRNILQKMCGWEEEGKVKDLDIKSVFDGTGTVG